MRYLPVILCLIFAGLVGFRYYTPSQNEPILKPEKLVLVSQKQVEISYDTAFSQYLRTADFKRVLRSKDWITRVETSIEAQDRLILFYHNEITKRRKLLNRQVSELAKLNNN